MVSKRLCYENKNILAPMVRVGTLPMRLLALDYGADIVYSEELIDWKFLRSVRRVNDVLKTVDFIDKSDGTIIFRTCAKEKDRVVLQMGTCDAERALQVAKLVENDVAAIDINMGCPKEFSIKGGMGAKLLTEPEKAKAILTTLVQNVNIPITCKIRVFEDVERTIQLAQSFASTGIAAIGVHGRTTQERPRHPNRNSAIKRVAEALNIPVIANGVSREMGTFEDFERFREQTGCSSIMIARAAQGNCSIFSKDGLKDLDEVIVEYLKYAIEYDNSPSNTKYCVQNMLKDLQETPRGKRFLECQTLEQICTIWDLANYCRQKQLEYQEKGILGRREITPSMFSSEPKRAKMDDDIIKEQCAFIRASYSYDPDLPKSKLMMHCSKNHMKPIYETFQEDKLFRSVVSVDGKRYSSTFWEKSKRYAEQGAAIVCLLSIGLIEYDSLVKGGSVLK